LRPAGSTNLWDGLMKGLAHMKENSASKNCSLFLLTDGEPTDHPGGKIDGYGPALKSYIETHGLPCTIDTFGFGYSLNSALLNLLASIGRGRYSFIPDSGLVGTVFVNAVSNVLATYATEVALTFPSLPASIKTGDHWNGYQVHRTGNTVRINLGSLQSGQTRDFVITSGSPLTESLEVEVEYRVGGKQKTTKKATGVPGTLTADQKARLTAQSLRLEVINLLSHIIPEASVLTKSQQLIAATIQQIQASEPTDTYVLDLLKDVEGQVTEACSKQEWFKKWGRHYLPSLMGAHLFQQCNNFKDPGVQHYGGELFMKLRDQIDDIFLALPPPKPSRAVPAAGGAAPAPVNMAGYYNAGGG